MAQQPVSTVNPDSLSLPSTAGSSTTPAHNPRKRPRSDMTPEEKREARAHRNRIAAQNSRDKRKAQFHLLEQRVAELEAENSQLRSTLSVTQPSMVLTPPLSERERQRDRENQELRERIKVLEQGWASVVQALTAAGQSIPALGLPPLLTQETKPTSPRLGIDADSMQELLRPQSRAASVTSTPSLTFSSLTASTDDSARHPARMANTSDSLTSVPEVSLQRAKFLSMPRRSRASKLKIPLSPLQRKQILRLMPGYKISCIPASTHQQHRRRLLSLLLRSIHQRRPRSKG